MTRIGCRGKACCCQTSEITILMSCRGLSCPAEWCRTVRDRWLETRYTRCAGVVGSARGGGALCAESCRCLTAPLPHTLLAPVGTLLNGLWRRPCTSSPNSQARRWTSVRMLHCNMLSWLLTVQVVRVTAAPQRARAHLVCLFPSAQPVSLRSRISQV